MNFELGTRGRFAVLAGLVITSIVPLSKANPLPRTLPTNRTANGVVRGTTASFSPVEQAASGLQDSDAHTPPAPAAAEHTAIVPLQVTYEDGQLTIIAENSLLTEILSALHEAMGAEIDLPASASSQRIWVRLGPGPARKVLGELLSGTELNYVIQGSTTDADGIRSVLLTPHSDAGPGGPGISNEPSERVASRRFPRATASPVEAPPAEQEIPAPPEPTVASDVTPPSPSSPPAATQTAATEVQPSVGNLEAHPSPPASLTPQQMMQQLTTMYQQRKQLQQNPQALPPTQ